MNRIVTGFATDGRTTIVRNDDLPPMTGERKGKSEMRVVWATSNPFAFSISETDLPGRETPAYPGSGEARFMLFTVPPNFVTAMHRTSTADYLVIIAGELWLVMEDGSEARLLPGDTVVQCATIHAWENRSNEQCMLAATMIGLKD